MPSPLTLTENLRTVRDQVVANLVAETASPKPSYTLSDSNGSRSVSWTEWEEAQTRMIATLNKLINQLNPYIVTTKQVL